jgi:inward rectifier potassium channel
MLEIQSYALIVYNKNFCNFSHMSNPDLDILEELGTSKNVSTNDTGFTNKSLKNMPRAFNPDGNVNIKRKLGAFGVYDLYHSLIIMSWFKFILIIIAYYFIANCLFAGLYLLIGIENFEGFRRTDTLSDFWYLFFFSAQTLTTVGYGHIHPISFGGNLLSAIEAMIGLLGFAFATSILYARFARPSSKILYSKHALISPYQNITGFIFRLVNAKPSNLIEVKASVILGMNDLKTENRHFFELKLEREKINFLTLNWNIVHPIDATSPMFNITIEELKARSVEFYILIRGFDDSYSEIVYSRRSYTADEMLAGYKFVPMPNTDNGKGQIEMDITTINEIEKV